MTAHFKVFDKKTLSISVSIFSELKLWVTAFCIEVLWGSRVQPAAARGDVCTRVTLVYFLLKVLVSAAKYKYSLHRII